MLNMQRIFGWIFCLIIVLLTPAMAFGQGQLGSVGKAWDVPGGGDPVAGDTISYTVTVPNVGNAPLNDVVFSDFPDPLTALVNGSVTTTHGTVVVGNNAGDSNIVVDVGTLAPGESAVITFEVTVFDGIQYPVMISNQGFVNTDNGNSPTDDPNTDPPGDPTDTPVDPQGMPDLGPANLTCALLTDVDGGGQISVGDTVRYSVSVPNNGTVAILDATFTNTPDPNTSLVVGSVVASQGTVLSGNSAGDTTIIVALGNVPVDATVTISFDVVIDNNVTQISNQGFIDYQGNTTPTDDASTGALNDTTVCSVFPVQSPEILPLKAVSLTNDLDGTGAASPGDTLTYTITVRNNGGVAATNVSFMDSPDPQTRLVNGTVTTTVGAVTMGNAANHTDIDVNIGTLNPGQSAIIQFDVTINLGATGMISNQGVVNTPTGPTPTDNPNSNPPGDPTDTPVTPQQSPELGDPEKIASMVVDADGNGAFSQGDTIRYTITIPNTGQAIARDLVFMDTPDPNTSLVPGTVVTSQGNVVLGNNPADGAINVDIGDLAGGNTVTLSFNVRIGAGATSICNQGTLQSATGVRPTNNPATQATPDPTCTPVTPQGPPVVPVKEFSVLQDADGSGGVSAGDTLRYTITIPNISVTAVPDLVFTDMIDPYTTLLPGRVNTSQGTVQRGNNPGDDMVRVNVGNLNSGQSVTIFFDVVVNSGAQRIVNQAFVDAPSIERKRTDDPHTPEPNDPTVTTIIPAPNARCEFELVSRLSSTVLAVQFDDNSIADGTNIVDWMWDFGDGGTCNRDNLKGCSARFGETVLKGTLQSPIHLFDGLGRFVVELKVTDQNGTDSINQCAFTFGDPTVMEVLDENANLILEDNEIITAIDYWILGTPVPNTNGKTVTDKMILTLIDKWIKAEEL